MKYFQNNEENWYEKDPPMPLRMCYMYMYIHYDRFLFVFTGHVTIRRDANSAQMPQNGPS